MNNGHTNNGSIRNVIYQNTGIILSLNNIRYLCTKMNNDINNHDPDFINNLSSVDQMISYFRQKGFDYYCLLHTDQFNISNVDDGVSTDSNVNSHIPDFINDCTNTERRDVIKFCTDNREDLLLNNAQHLMLTIAWILPQER